MQCTEDEKIVDTDSDTISNDYETENNPDENLEDIKSAEETTSSEKIVKTDSDAISNDHKTELNPNNGFENINESEKTKKIVNIFKGQHAHTMKLEMESTMKEIREFLAENNIMHSNESFFRKIKHDNNDIIYSIIDNEDSLKLEEIVSNDMYIYILPKVIESDELTVGIETSYGNTFSITLNKNDKLSQIREYLTNLKIMNSNDMFYDKTGDSSNSIILHDYEKDYKSTDIVTNGRIRVGCELCSVYISRGDENPTINNVPTSIRELNAKLKVIRADWEDKDRMQSFESFMKPKQINGKTVYSFIDKQDERSYILKAIIDENKSVKVGCLNCGDAQNLVYREVVKKFLNGFTFEGKTGKSELTARRVATLKAGHLDIADPTPSTLIKADYTFSENEFQKMKQGVSQSSLSLDVNAYSTDVDGGVSVGHESSQSSSGSSLTMHNIGRVLCQKKKLSLNSKLLKMDPLFFSDIKDALGSGQVDVRSAGKLVNVLNLYGWYLPLEYILGGAKLEIQTKTLKSRQEAESVHKEFAAHLKVSYSGFGASASASAGAEHKESSKKETSTSQRNEETNSYHEFIGGKASKNDEEFINSLSDQNNWNIIEFIGFMPSLKLLYYEDPYIFAHCLKLLIQFHGRSTIKAQQKFINIVEYARKLELEKF